MTAILTTAYFYYEPTKVPNINGSGDPHTSIQNGILALAELYEVAFLRKILGTAFADEFYTHKADSSGIWHNLKDQIYVVSGSIYTGPVANYVYHHWLKDQQSQTTGIGSVKPKPEGGEVVSNKGKIIANWNRMVDMIENLRIWVDDNSTIYTTYISGDTGWEEFELMNQWGI
jgi:hypothetical protein